MQGDMKRLSDLIQENLAKFPTQRIGQVVFNALVEVAPEIANEIRGTEFDPFYKGNYALQGCLDKIAELMSPSDPTGFLPYPRRS